MKCLISQAKEFLCHCNGNEVRYKYLKYATAIIQLVFSKNLSGYSAERPKLEMRRLAGVYFSVPGEEWQLKE